MNIMRFMLKLEYFGWTIAFAPACLYQKTSGLSTIDASFVTVYSKR